LICLFLSLFFVPNILRREEFIDELCHFVNDKLIDKILSGQLKFGGEIRPIIL
jgi:hypothetical protein